MTINRFIYENNKLLMNLITTKYLFTFSVICLVFKVIWKLNIIHKGLAVKG